MNSTLILGAVAYDPKVVTIWDGFQRHFAKRGLGFDYVLYTNYESQVEAHLRGEIHVAWNSPLAFIEAERAGAARGKKAEAIAMRDTDRDLTSVVLVKKDSPFQSVADLRDHRVGVGAADSPQATLIPLLTLAEAGLEPERDFHVVRHDLLLGKHGDHIGGEREAVRALMAGKVQAACVIDGNHLAFTREGSLPSGSVRALVTTGKYDHCNFTVFDDAPKPLVARFRELLLAMSFDDAEVRPLLELEGLKAWVPGRTDGYALLARAVDRFGYLGPWLERATAAGSE
jgi:ABC-type phosphate/phosphonate transport system substrate-binding protein